MRAAIPHFLLYSEASAAGGSQSGWKFVLQSVGGDDHFSAADCEFEGRVSRLELLAVVRGLEALDQPSRVTLLTHSRYVRRGIRRELNHWRASRWRWERFGNLVPICDHDLWRRVDRALQFHDVECIAWSQDEVAATALSRSRRQHAAPASFERSAASDRLGTSIAAALGRLRRGVLTPIWARWRPAFTWAA